MRALRQIFGWLIGSRLVSMASTRFPRRELPCCCIMSAPDHADEDEQDRIESAAARSVLRGHLPEMATYFNLP